jgi:hypothetical protein
MKNPWGSKCKNGMKNMYYLYINYIYTYDVVKP